MKAAVVGAGIVGASAAYELVRRGHQVTVFEQFEPGHRRGSSHGNSRIVRKAYPNAAFTAIMQEAYPLWGELEAASGRHLLTECGLIYFGDPNSPTLQEVVYGLRENQVKHDILDHLQAAALAPGLHFDTHEIAVLTPEAGWVHAGRAVQTTVELAQNLGAQVLYGSRADPEVLSLTYDVVLLAAGAWVLKHVELEAKVTLQTFAYVRDRFREGPVWIEDSLDFPYGFPSEPGRSDFKLALHRLGPPVGPDEDRPMPETDQLLDVLRRRFGMTDPAFDGSQTCLYTNTPDEGFRFGRIGEKIVWASACSGHGFKFGPWTGRQLAKLALGESIPQRIP